VKTTVGIFVVAAAITAAPAFAQKPGATAEHLWLTDTTVTNDMTGSGGDGGGANGGLGGAGGSTAIGGHRGDGGNGGGGGQGGVGGVGIGTGTQIGIDLSEAEHLGLTVPTVTIGMTGSGGDGGGNGGGGGQGGFGGVGIVTGTQMGIDLSEAEHLWLTNTTVTNDITG
jgi:hypothetical protein